MTRLIRFTVFCVVIIIASTIVVVTTAFAQDTSILSNLPNDPVFFALWALSIVGMVAHWFWKKVIRKDTTVADFLTYFFGNFQWTLAALLAAGITLSGEWGALQTMSWSLPAKYIMIFTAGWIADSAGNSSTKTFRDPNAPTTQKP